MIIPHLGDVVLEAFDFELADSLTVIFRPSKTDQNRVGCSRTVFSTGDDLCPVEAHKALRRLRGVNWSLGDAAMGDGSGWVMNRDVMTAILKATAVDLGLDGADFATHSLRLGGATAMAATGLVHRTTRSAALGGGSPAAGGGTSTPPAAACAAWPPPCHGCRWCPEDAAQASVVRPCPSSLTAHPSERALEPEL